MPISYDSLKILIGYLDVHHRFDLALNCPSLRTTEKVVPLKIPNLDLTGPNSISVNDHKMKLQELSPRLFKLIIFSPRGKKIMKLECSMNQDLQSALKRLVNLLISDRRNLTVYRLHACPSLLSPTAKFQSVRWLNLAESCNNSRELEANIDQSLPLDVLGIQCHPGNFQNLDHPMVRTAQKLVFHYPNYDARFSNVYRIPHKHINLSLTDNARCYGQVLRGILTQWRRNFREIGDVFSFYIKTEFFIQLMNQFDSILSRFDGERIDLWTMIVPMNNAIQIQIKFEGVVNHDGIHELDDWILSLPHVYMRAEGTIVLTVVPNI